LFFGTATHEVCAEDAKPYFSPACSEIPQEYLMYGKEVLGRLTENLQADFVQALRGDVPDNQPKTVEKRHIFALI
jgi:hypothetical protein